MPIPPLALSVIMCDAVHRDWENGKWFLLGAFSKLRFSTFPSILHRMQVFLSLIEVNGAFNLRARIVDVDEADDPIHESGGLLESREPLAVLEFALPLVDVRFPEAGEFRLQILIGDEIIAERKLIVEQIPGGSNDG